LKKRKWGGRPRERMAGSEGIGGSWAAGGLTCSIAKVFCGNTTIPCTKSTTETLKKTVRSVEVVPNRGSKSGGTVNTREVVTVPIAIA